MDGFVLHAVQRKLTALVACIFHSEHCYTEKQEVSVQLKKKIKLPKQAHD